MSQHPAAGGRARPTAILVGAPGSGAPELAQLLRAQYPAQTLQIECPLAEPLTPQTGHLSHSQTLPSQGQDAVRDEGATAAWAEGVIASTAAWRAHRTAPLHHGTRSAAPGAPSGLVFLMGLDRVLAASSTVPPAQIAMLDAALRLALSQHGIAYQVLYGPLQARQLQVLRSIKTIAESLDISQTPGSSDANSPMRPSRARIYDCEKCSDPVCEHRLFTALLASGRSRADSADGDVT